MAAKQKTVRKPKSADSSSTNAAPSPLVAITKASALMVVAGVASAVSQLTLSPVYGSIPASIWHSKAVLSCLLVAVVSKGALKNVLGPRTSRWIPVLAFWSQPMQALLFRYSASLGAIYGPVVTEALTLFPVLLLSIYCAIDLLDTCKISSFNSTFAEIISPLACYVTFSSAENFVTGLLPPLMGSNPFLTRSGLSFLVAALYAVLSPSALLLLILPALFHSVRLNPHFPGSANFAVLNQTLNEHNYTILERRESLTGYVSVLESQESYFRILRCDHSLLGGEWKVTPARMESGQWHPEPIYSVFAMLEAVRLVKTGPADEQRPDSEKTALNIGLGIGTAPGGMMRHGINTTIVELDPAVHAMATKYFGLPSNHTAVISDAVPYVASTAAERPGSFNYIIHDVFTGGAEPAALFTFEFLAGLKTLLNPTDGVVAINYAGDLKLPTTRLVLHTIHAVFPSCRIFRDHEPAQEKDGSDFINMIVFCRPVAEPIRFRQPEEPDFLNSRVRERMLFPRSSWEVPFTPDADADVLRRGGEAVLERGHQKSAVEHWGIMRMVIPAAVWELW
ncbi:S-adenosyl-L-methionine-dependent methyltransferase [Phyllosticta citribraziliensis]|uniref:S-adenosyl-L-methionine-dependent methyltransferase n=1 Tax=Phyllosticta citribraziliensis TaxID=989973 RepID=A0ABR1LNI2_9PEZI